MNMKTIKSIVDRKYKTFDFSGVWQQAFGKPETNGIWIVWGKEKNGKTWFSLMLADYLSSFEKSLYISAEEGFSKTFQEACKRSGISHTNTKLKFTEYVTIEELEVSLKKQRSPKIVLLDNTTIYKDELSLDRIKSLAKRFKNTLFIFIAHEEKGEPYTVAAKNIRRLSQIIVHVKGLRATVSGRCPGGTINIHEEKAQLYWGTDTPKTETDDK